MLFSSCHNAFFKGSIWHCAIRFEFLHLACLGLAIATEGCRLVFAEDLFQVFVVIQILWLVLHWVVDPILKNYEEETCFFAILGPSVRHFFFCLILQNVVWKCEGSFME